jgi:hypothetical protein
LDHARDVAHRTHTGDLRIGVPGFGSFAAGEGQQDDDLWDRSIALNLFGRRTDVQGRHSMFFHRGASGLAVAGHHVRVGDVQGNNGICGHGLSPLLMVEK